MFGLIILPLIGLWFLFAIWAAGKINQYFWRDKEVTGVAELGQLLSLLLLTAFVFLLPLMDQIIAYPKWQQMCATTGDFEWGPGMDEEKAYGRELIVYGSMHETTIFPNIHVTYFSRQFKDVKTEELVLNMPHASYYKAKGMFHFPTASGNNQAILLHGCTNKIKSQKVINYLNQFNLKVIDDKS
jgi:hypothetical protein